MTPTRRGDHLRIPSLASVATGAIRQLSRRAVIITLIVCSVMTLTGVIFLLRPLELRFSRFSDDTQRALSARNQELVRSSVQQGANDMVRLLGNAETVVDEMSTVLQSRRNSAHNSIPPLEKDFFIGGRYASSLKSQDGYQDKVTFDLPQLKTNDPSEIHRIAPYWLSFLNAAKAFHSHSDELKWIYLGTQRGSFLVFPASPEIPSGYDPRTRSWYQEARTRKDEVWTSPYFTAGGNDLVLTVAKELKSGPLRGDVVGTDVVMSDVINNLLATPYCEHCTFYLVSGSGEILGKKGDQAVGHNWTSAPKTRLLLDDLNQYMPAATAREISEAISKHTDQPHSHLLSRVPNAISLATNSSNFAFYSAPIDILGWHLLGVAAKQDPGADGNLVLNSISKISSEVWRDVLVLGAGIVGLAALLLWVFSYLARIVLRRTLQPSMEQLAALASGLDQLKLDDSTDLPETLSKEESLFRERTAILDAMRRMLARLRSEREAHEKLRVQAEVGQQARLVSHNMRSPLESLELALPYLKDAPEEKVRIIRSAVKEIRDLANTVKAKGRTEQTLPSPTSEKKTPARLRPELITTLIEGVVSERRAAFPNIDIAVTEESQVDAFGVFVNVDTVEFRYLLANLLNNAAEACAPSKGRVVVRITQESGYVCIDIDDSGKGIPAEVLPKLGEKGATYGKENGTGLGLHHAITTAKFFGGNLNIQSELGKGTTVSLKIPKAPAPKWFASAVTLRKELPIAILDDDGSIHATWDYRLARASRESPVSKPAHFYKTEEFKAWASDLSEDAIFLVDYEIRGEKQNGLDLIEELRIAEKSYLVTASHEDSAVIARAEWLGVKILPKELLAIVPFRVQ